MALFKEFCDVFTREMNRLRMEGSADLETARSELTRIERELDTLLNLILRGGAADRINVKMVQLEGRKPDLERQLADSEIPPPPAPSRDGNVLPRTSERFSRGVTG